MEIEPILNCDEFASFHHDVVPPPEEQSPHVSDSALSWTRSRQPFSPLTMGCALPYLDVFTVQSKRLLPLSRKDLDGKRQQQQIPPKSNRESEFMAEEPADSSPRTGRLVVGDDLAAKEAAVDESLRVPTHPTEEMLEAVRLLVEPIAIPDLTHTGVSWQNAAGVGRDVGGQRAEAFCVTLPNHTFEETQVKLFYPTGAKNSNMREYIRNTIQAHMGGLLAHDTASSLVSTKGALLWSQSAPNLAAHAENDASGDGGISVSPKSTKSKKKKLQSHSPAKFSPKKTDGVSSGARLSGSVSTSGLLNPELTRQAKDILAQLRSNTNKINDLIGS